MNAPSFAGRRLLSRTALGAAFVAATLALGGCVAVPTTSPWYP